MPKKQMDATNCDVAIIGAGPAGLSLACMLDAEGLRTVVVERQPRAALENPAYDGRDIALTHRSLDILDGIGALDFIDNPKEAPINHARVLNGTSHYSLHFENPNAKQDGSLGYLVANNRIRKAVFEAFGNCRAATLLTEVSVTSVKTDATGGDIALADGRRLRARLIVAADSRFSETRRKMGIAARLRDFGRICIVCRMTHEHPHDQTAYECFQYDQTLAVLPMGTHDSSVVITIASDRAQALLDGPVEDFNADVTRRFEARFGKMTLIGDRHSYPLVAVYADRFYAQRLALVGDAAVGMHPVTAHGFNFGLNGAQTLSNEISKAKNLGLDIGGAPVLAAYDAAHRKATRPLYLATNAIVGLYTDTRRPARMLRDALLRIGNAMAPARRVITGRLTRTG